MFDRVLNTPLRYACDVTCESIKHEYGNVVIFFEDREW